MRGCVLGDKANDIISSFLHSCELPIDASVRPVPYYQYNIRYIPAHISKLHIREYVQLHTVITYGTSYEVNLFNVTDMFFVYNF